MPKVGNPHAQAGWVVEGGEGCGSSLGRQTWTERERERDEQGTQVGVGHKAKLVESQPTG